MKYVEKKCVNLNATSSTKNSTLGDFLVFIIVEAITTATTLITVIPAKAGIQSERAGRWLF